MELMERCKSGMYKVARSYLKDDADIADAIQETVINCYEHIRDGLKKDADYFKTWLTGLIITVRIYWQQESGCILWSRLKNRRIRVWRCRIMNFRN